MGYLEGVHRSDGGRTQVEEDVLPESLREGSAGDLYRLPEDAAGFVHAPSINHATAAAVLRNGYLTHATPDDPGRLAVDLSSRRVRRAKELMDGVRNGQPLEVLLGIELERGMHDATTRATDPVVLNDLKPALRQAFPIKRTRIPPAGHPDDEPVVVPDFSVVNGLDVVAAGDGWPAGVPGLPALSTAEDRRAQGDPAPGDGLPRRAQGRDDDRDGLPAGAGQLRPVGRRRAVAVGGRAAAGDRGDQLVAGHRPVVHPAADHRARPGRDGEPVAGDRDDAASPAGAAAQRLARRAAGRPGDLRLRR